MITFSTPQFLENGLETTIQRRYTDHAVYFAIEPTEPWTFGSIGIAQLVPLRPKLLRFENSCRRDDARDQFRRRHVEPRIPRATGRIRHANIDAPR